ncbi:MAG TPA: radical SAM protein [Phycisphaerae bacterium]|nr:radical SAM protein [Phycisphaerae bacterium]
MKVLFVYVPNRHMTDRRIYPPLGILYLSAALRRGGYHNIEFVDLNLLDDITPAAIEAELARHNADIVGVSFASPQFPYARQVAQFYKERLGDEVLLVAGGVHATVEPVSVIERSSFDVAAVGEAEQTFVELVRDYDRLGRTETFFESLRRPGFCLADRASAQAVNFGKALVGKYLDDLAIPDRSLIDWSQYTRTLLGKRCAVLMTSRGCPHRCAFCATEHHERRVRFHSPEYVIREIAQIKQTVGTNHVLFLDDTLTTNRRRMVRICELIKQEHPDLVWRGWTRTDAIDQELLYLMRESGCYALCYGVESGSDAVLKRMRKGTTVEMNRRAIEMTKRAGIKCRASFIIGNPGDTQDTIDETVDFLVATKPDDWLMSSFVPVPGSETYRHPERFGIELFPEEIEANQWDNYFVIGYQEQSGRVFRFSDGRGPEWMQQMRDYAHRRLRRELPREKLTV